MAIYTVKAGDTLSSIAKNLGYSNWQDLYNLNKAVIGSNPNLIRTGAKLTYGSTSGGAAPTPVAPVSPTVSAGTQQGTQAGEAVRLTPFGEILSEDEWFRPELIRGTAEQAAAQYYAPLVQRGREGLEGQYANRGLTRSGLRGQAVGDMYQDYGRQQQKTVLEDILTQQEMARQDYGMMQELYESTEGREKPTATQYTPYEVAQPKTAAGTYGSSYIDWINRVGQTNQAKSSTPTAPVTQSGGSNNYLRDLILKSKRSTIV